jgi:hypothetical protein
MASAAPTIVPLEFIALGRQPQPPGGSPMLISTPFPHLKAGLTYLLCEKVFE